MTRRRINYDEVKQLRATPQRDGRPMPVHVIAAAAGCSESYVRLILNGSIGGPTPDNNTRMQPKALFGRAAQRMPAIDSPAIIEGRTLFPSTVYPVASFPHAVLKSGHNSAKIGKRISKGRWKGFEVYTLTLQERATCPKTCHHWRSCFGNNMQHAQRIEHGEALEARLIEEVAALADKHPGGFAVRLHTLGDFYSVRYVEMWAALIEHIPQLHAFGFSARWDYQRDPIAKALVDLVLARWDRFAIRFSNAPVDECSTVSIEHPYQKPADALICPQQMGKTATCSTCALCWQSKRRVAFVQH